MVDLVEGFREVKEDGVYLARLVEAVGEVAESSYELGLATSTVAKAMLEVRRIELSSRKSMIELWMMCSRSLQAMLVREIGR